MKGVLIYNFSFKKREKRREKSSIVINTVIYYQQINCLHFLVPGKHCNVIHALHLSLLKQSHGKMSLVSTLLVPLKSDFICQSQFTQPPDNTFLTNVPSDYLENNLSKMQDWAYMLEVVLNPVESIFCDYWTNVNYIICHAHLYEVELIC